MRPVYLFLDWSQVSPPASIPVSFTGRLAMDMNEDTVELFLNNSVFSPARQTVLVAALESLKGANDRELFMYEPALTMGQQSHDPT